MVAACSHHVRHVLLTTVYLFLLVPMTVANVEKIIFTAPPLSTKLENHSALASLGIDTLTPDAQSIRTSLKRVFASQRAPSGGYSSWIMLANLTVERRYELRVCWSALVSGPSSMQRSRAKIFVRLVPI